MLLWDFPRQQIVLLGAVVSSTDAAAVFSVLRGSGLQIRQRAADLTGGALDAERQLFCAATKADRTTGQGLSDKAVWRLVKQAARDVQRPRERDGRVRRGQDEEPRAVGEARAELAAALRVRWQRSRWRRRCGGRSGGRPRPGASRGGRPSREPSRQATQARRTIGVWASRTQRG